MKAQHQPVKKPTKQTTNKTTKTPKPKPPSTSTVVKQEKVDDEIDTTDIVTPAAAQTTTTLGSTSPLMSPYGGMGMMGMGMGMGMMPYGGMYGGMMGSQYLFSLNQFLFSIQSIVFSFAQAVQIVGMNAQQIKSMASSLRGAVENCLENVREWGRLDWEEMVEGVLGEKSGEVKRFVLGDGGVDDERRKRREENMSESEIVRRRRLAALRWTMTLSVSYLLYRSVRQLIRGLIFGGDSGRHNRRGYMSPSSYNNGGMYSGQYGMMHGRQGGYPGNGYYGGSGMGYGGGYGGRSHYDSYSHYGGSGYY